MLIKSVVNALNSRRMSFTYSIWGVAVVPLIVLMCVTVATAQGRKYGLFVGINEYNGSNQRLHGAVNDATKLRQQMIKDFEFKEGDTNLLTDAAATRKGIIDGIKSYEKKVKAGDLFLFTYSGHGTVFPDASSAVLDEHNEISMDVLLPGGRFKIPKGFYDSAIVPIDSDDGKDGRAWKNLILDDELYSLFLAFSQKQVQVIVFSDACNNGTVGKAAAAGASRVKFMSPLQALQIKSLDELKPVKRRNRARVRQRDRWGAYLILSASKDNEFSLDMDGDKPGEAGGLFTKTVLTVLNSGQGPFTYAELLLRVRPEVVRLSRDEGIDQTPQIDTRFGDPNATIFSFQKVGIRRSH